MNFINKYFNLTGKVAVLIGAGGLLVGEISKGLASVGVKVALLDLDIEKTNILQHEINTNGGTSIVIKTDVTKKQSFEEALEIILKEFGRIDILVNGAGANSPTPFFEITLDEWNHILNIQLTGTMLSCQVFGEHMIKNKNGSIINISSTAADPPLSKVFTYSVAKAGVKNLSQNLAREWALNNVRVNILRPGFFPSEFMKEKMLSPERTESILQHTPMKRFGNPIELVGAVLWLCSDSASFVTGAEICVDGGFAAMSI